jgi:hypothetical protein
VGGDSVEARVGDCRRVIRQFALDRVEAVVEVDDLSQAHERLHGVWMVGQGSVHVEHGHVLGALGGHQKGGGLGIDAGVVGADEGIRAMRLPLSSGNYRPLSDCTSPISGGGFPVMKPAFPTYETCFFSLSHGDFCQCHVQGPRVLLMQAGYAVTPSGESHPSRPALRSQVSWPVPTGSGDPDGGGVTALRVGDADLVRTCQPAGSKRTRGGESLRADQCSPSPVR